MVVVALLAMAYGPAVQVRDRLWAGKADLEAGRDALLSGDAEAAAAAFSAADSAFIRAGASARTAPLRVLGWLPLLGATPDATVALADAGRLTAQAGIDVAHALRSVGGVAALAPQKGAFEARTIGPLAQPARLAAERVASALDLLRSAPGSGLLPPVATARAAALTELTRLEHWLRSGSQLLGALPEFLGWNRAQRYFFGPVNPAELRGSGGFLGAYSILAVDEGSMSFGRFHDIRTLSDAPVSRIEPPSADYARNYDRFGGAGFWRNINMTPDFPSAAVAIERLYERGTGQKIDGVILADPFALQALLGTTGPVDVPVIGRTLSADDVVAFTANQAYSEFSDPGNRKTLLGAAAAAVFEAFMRGSGSPIESARALVRAVSEGHLSIYSDHPGTQRALVGVDAAGALSARRGDFLSLVQNNAGGNKVDYYLTRSVDYSIRLGADGTGAATVHVRLRNDAPLTGASSEVLGPYGNASARSENVSYTTLYCSTTCRLNSAEIDGRTEAQQIGSERGFTSLQQYVHMASGTTASLLYRLDVGRVWFGDATRGRYQLTFLNQATIRPTSLRVRVQLPSGMVLSSSNVPVQVSGSNVSWQGVPQRRLEIEIRFQRPWLPGMMQEITEFLTKPVFRIP